MLKKISFEIETITPMFLSGADQSKAELRAASIKGLLRFWWRALQAEPDLNKLRVGENAIFGSSDEKTGGGSSFSMCILYEKPLKASKEKFPKQNIMVTSKGKSFSVNILEYLAYGTLEYKKVEGNVFIREYLPAGTKFRLSLSSQKSNIDELLKTFSIFCRFGGIGSRSRNGFGSFHVTNNAETFSSVNNGGYLHLMDTCIKEVLPQSYPSFSVGAKLFRTRTSYETWDKALAEIGKVYRGIRSGEVKTNNKIFETKHSYEKRQYIGSPIIADKKDRSFLDRHAKPYFIKVAKEDNRYRSYILYLPSLYCEGKDNDNQNRPINHEKVNTEFRTICNEFNEFLSQNENIEPVP